MKLLIEFIPVGIFLAVYWAQQDLELATIALMIATVVAILASRILLGRVDKMLWITLFAALLFGGLTVFFNDGIFIKIKPTVVNLVFALVCIGSHFVGNKRSLFARLLGDKLSLPETAWRNISILWVTVFLTAACANLLVLLHFSELVWVNFRLFGLLTITLTGLIAQTVYLVFLAKKQSIFPNTTGTHELPK